MLETIASDPGLQQIELVFLGLFGRACRILESQSQQVISSRNPAQKQSSLLFGQSQRMPLVVEGNYGGMLGLSKLRKSVSAMSHLPHHCLCLPKMSFQKLCCRVKAYFTASAFTAAKGRKKSLKLAAGNC